MQQKVARATLVPAYLYALYNITSKCSLSQPEPVQYLHTTESLKWLTIEQIVLQCELLY